MRTDCADPSCWRQCHRAGIGDTGEHHARSAAELLKAIRADLDHTFGRGTVTVSLRRLKPIGPPRTKRGPKFRYSDEQLRAALRKHGSIAAAARALGITRPVFYRRGISN